MQPAMRLTLNKSHTTAMPSRTLNDVLTEAINDLAQHGFDSAARIERWMRALREAAEATLTSRRTMERILNDALLTIYKRMVERDGILKYHPGVERFTLQQIKPSLRAELDRRIMASAELIKLNREEAIQKTLQRFSGWATSIPKGGSKTVNRKKEKRDIRKSIVSEKFVARRVVIDQGHKLVSSINDLVAKDGGAIAGRWNSHWRQTNYNFREDHKERDGEVYLFRNSWARKAGFVKVGKAGYSDEITQPAEEVYCRCFWTFVYNLRDLPSDMLTEKGKNKLAEVRAEIARSRKDSDDDSNRLIFEAARRFDRLKYLEGLKQIIVSPEGSQWHAGYDPDKDEIVIQPKFERETVETRLHIMLHEAGHRGQDVDADTYEKFKKLHLNQISSFLSMANSEHLEAYQKTGKVEDSIASEVFAESYARFMMGKEMPDVLREFWELRNEMGRSDNGIYSVRHTDGAKRSAHLSGDSNVEA